MENSEVLGLWKSTEGHLIRVTSVTQDDRTGTFVFSFDIIIDVPGTRTPKIYRVMPGSGEMYITDWTVYYGQSSGTFHGMLLI